MLSKLSLSRKVIWSGNQAHRIQSYLFLNNKRYFATNESQVTPNTEYENAQEKKDLKRSIAKKSPTFMRLWYALGLAGIVGATMYYLNEDDRYERKVEHVLKQIGSHDQEIRRKGIETLDSCLFLEKRLFSGVTEIPQSKDYLIKEGVVDVLLEAFKEGDEDIKYKSVIWLLRLVSYEEARNRIVANSNGIPVILNLLSSTSTNSKLWLSTSSLLLELAKYNNTFTNYYQELKNLESKMYGSNPIHPLSPLIAAKLNTILLNSDTNALNSINSIPSDKLQLLTSNPCEAAVKSALNAVIPKEPTPLNPPDALLRGDNIINLNALLNPLLFGIFGSVWGNLRWRSAGFFGGLSGQDLKKFTTKNNRVGRYVFFLLVLDPVAETLMAWPSKGIRLPLVENPVQIPSQIYGYPVSTYVPIAESVVFVASSLYAIRYQKYVVLPLSAAILAAHFDQFHNVVKPYLDSAGIPDPIENIEKAIKSKLLK